MMIRIAFSAALLLAGAAPALAADPLAIIDRNGSVVAVVPYARNIVRVTIALDRDKAASAPGYGIAGTPDPVGWTHNVGAAGDVFASTGLTLTVDPQPSPRAPSQMERYFAPSLPPVTLSLRKGDGPTITMTGWSMTPHDVAGEHSFLVGASFRADEDEHFYGLGQNQDGTLDLKGRTIDCRHWYDAPPGEQVCVPFLVSSKGYGIVWDNPSATQVSPGLHGQTRFQSNVGERVSFFLITGRTPDDLYAGYAKLTGRTPLPPKAAFGLIQSKARYESQQELLDIAEGYRRRGYPLDVMVLDWFYWTRMGQARHRPDLLPRPGRNEPATPC